jgi:hypothetical protein
MWLFIINLCVMARILFVYITVFKIPGWFLLVGEGGDETSWRPAPVTGGGRHKLTDIHSKEDAS